jgi:hypothetical protein
MSPSRRRIVGALTLAALAASLAGCLGAADDLVDDDALDVGTSGADEQPPTNGTGQAPPTPLEEAIAQDHDHADPAQHGFQWNLEDAGYHHGYGSDEAAAGGYRAMALGDDTAYVCRGGEKPGVVAFDVSDPEDPKPIDRFAMPVCNDVEVSDDGRWLVAGTQRNGPGAFAQASDAPGSFPRGAYLVDASDPGDLAFQDYIPVAYNGVHTVSDYTTEDGRIVFTLHTYELYAQADPTGKVPVAPPGAAPLAHRVEITEVVADEGGGGHHLERIGVYSDTGAAAEHPEDQVITHDTWIGTHPETGERLMVVAYWDQGVQIVDVDDFSNPQLASTFDDFSPSQHANIHKVKPFPTTIDGKWVLVAEPELVTAEESGQITLIDATDPENPQKLGYWTLPGEIVITKPFFFSPHNFDVDEGGRIYLSHQHAGAWVISVDDPGTLEEPVTVGGAEITAPDDAPEASGPAPKTWGVLEQDGYIYATDTPTGLHVKEYTGP